MSVLERGAPAHDAARATYLACLPAAEPLFGFGDFVLFRLAVEQVRYVGGFAAAYTVSAERLRAAAG